MKIVKKPWGDFKTFVLNKKCTVKILTAEAKQMTSLQKHKNRREMWYFLTDGYVQIGKQKKKIKKGQIVNIKKRQAHRLTAKNKTVEILEISFGKFSERDLVRLEDKYGRKGTTKR